MKKLLLVTGIFLSLGLVASAQQKKPASPSATTEATQKKKTIKEIRAEKTAARLRKAEAKKKGNTSPGARDTRATAN